MGKDRVFIEVLQTRVMKLVYGGSGFVGAVWPGQLRPWTFSRLFDQHITPALRAPANQYVCRHYPNHIARFIVPLNTA